NLRDGQATSGTIVRAEDWLVAHAAPDAVAVFFYAGHARKLGPSSESILGADGNLVSDATLAAHLRNLRAQRTWIAMAACFGGGFTEMLGPGRVLTAAADANSLAYDNIRFGRSYMAEYMIRQGLALGRAWDSVQSAYGYAVSALQRDYPNRLPVEIDGDGAGPIDLTPPGAVRQAAAPASFDFGGGGGGSGSGGHPSSGSPSRSSNGRTSDPSAPPSSSPPPSSQPKPQPKPQPSPSPSPSPTTPPPTQPQPKPQPQPQPSPSPPPTTPPP